MHEPGAFRDEVLSQAKELYSLRLLHTNWAWVSDLAQAAFLQPKFTDVLSLADELLLLNDANYSSVNDISSTLSYGTPDYEILPRELLYQISLPSSEATAFDELPHMLLYRLSGFSVQTLTRWLSILRQGVCSYFLQSALHICLLKKEPYWLIRNSRPIILEPALRRMESAIIFRRLTSRGEAAGWIPPSFFSYRKEFSPILMAIFARCFVAFHALDSGQCFCIDWDESNAFCNVNRQELSLLLRFHENMNVGSWADWFFSTLLIYVQTPFGLTEPYTMRQGGAR